MDRKTLSVYVSIVTCVCLLSSCAPHFQEGQRGRVCNKLRGDLIFNGKTSNIREADIQKAQKPLIADDYDVLDCDER